MYKKQTMPQEMRDHLSKVLKERGIKPKSPFKASSVNHPMACNERG